MSGTIAAGNEFEFSTISSKLDTEPKSQRVPWDEYVASANNPKERTQEDGPWFIPVRFNDDGSVMYMTALVLEVAGKTIEEICELLGGYRYAAYTTIRSRDDVKWTVVIPYLRPASVQEHMLAYLAMQQKFGGSIDPTCKDPTRFFWEPSCSASDRAYYASVATEGGMFDPAKLGMAQAPSRSSSAAIPCSDYGNAQRLVKAAKGRYRYCVELGRWLVWNGASWQWDRDGAIERLAKETARTILNEAANAQQTTRRDELRRWSKDSESAYRIDAMIKLARTEPRIPLLANELDADPMLLGVSNGVIDLTTGKLRAATPEDYVTKFAAVECVPGAQCPKWERFVSDIFGGDQDMVRYTQKAVGYMLTGRTSEQCMFVLQGQGANGKTVLTETIKRMLGDYALTIAPHVLMARKYDNGGATPDLARLRGARCVIAAESEDGAVLASAFIKSATGEETISARELFHGPIEFRPSFKLVLATNHKPIIKDDGHGMWRRMQLIPFSVTFAKERQNPDLKAELLAELPGILNWALEGCRAWQLERLGPPRVVTAATDTYRSDMDLVGGWLAECCLIDHQAVTPFAGLWVSYETWHKDNGGLKLTKQALGRKLEERGYRLERIKGQKCRRGLRLMYNFE